MDIAWINATIWGSLTITCTTNTIYNEYIVLKIRHIEHTLCNVLVWQHCSRERSTGLKCFSSNCGGTGLLEEFQPPPPLIWGVATTWDG